MWATTSCLYGILAISGESGLKEAARTEGAERWRWFGSHRIGSSWPGR